MEENLIPRENLLPKNPINPNSLSWEKVGTMAMVPANLEGAP